MDVILSGPELSALLCAIALALIPLMIWGLCWISTGDARSGRSENACNGGLRSNAGGADTPRPLACSQETLAASGEIRTRHSFERCSGMACCLVSSIKETP